MDIKHILKSLEEGHLEEVAKYRGYCSAWLYRYNAEMGDLAQKRAKWLIAKRDDYKSYAECERAYEATEDGQRYLKVKFTIRGLENVSEALTTAHFANQRDAKL